jgi:shikimate kinase/tetratricopeptide (TPR) repeat protein
VNTTALPAAGHARRAEILVIGPIGAGKSTIGRLVSQRLGLPQVAVDAVRWGYYEQIGYDYDHAAALSREHGFEGLYRYWKRFELYAVERVVADHADCVVDFGGGHSVYEDDSFFERARRAVAPFLNVVLLLPSPDLDESVRLLRERTGMRPAEGGRLDFVEHFVRHHSNHDLATLTLYTHGKSPEETAEELLARVTWSPDWRLPSDQRSGPRTAERATTLLHAGTLASGGRHRDHATAGRYLDEALSIRRELGDDGTGLAEVLQEQAAVDVALGRVDDARRCLREALAFYEAVPRHAPPGPVREPSAPPTAAPPNRSPTGYARTLDGLARLDRMAGDWAAARRWYERAVEAWRPFGRGHTAGALKLLSEAAREQGDLVRARDAYQEALATFRALEDRREIASTQCLGGHLALAQGDLPTARARYAESFALLRGREDQAATGEILEGLVLQAAAEGQAATALTLAGAVAALTQEGRPPAAAPAVATRALRARYLEPAQATLSPEARARALAAGEAMSADGAIAYAAAYLEPLASVLQ